MTIRDWRRKARLRRLERRGDVIAHWSESVQALLEIGQDLIPGKDRELSRDLFGLLAYTWAAQATRTAAFDPHGVLLTIRTRAWLGYTDMEALLEVTRNDLPRAETGVRMLAFFEELARKRSTYLFLPIVSRIDRHQSGGDPLPTGALRVDGLTDRHANTTHGRIARDSFLMTPKATRERDTFLLALMVLSWDKGKWTVPELQAAVVAQLFKLYEAPSRALEAVRADMSGPGPEGALASDVIEAAEDISARAPWLWLETLFIAESWVSGPQWFAHAFEVKTIPSHNLL